MRFHVYHKKDFEGTAYIELVAGTYDGKHWQPGSCFVDDEDFVAVEGLILKHLSDYGHYKMNDISRPVCLAIIEEWRTAAVALDNPKKSVCDVLSINDFFEIDASDYEKHRLQISHMLKELAKSCEEFLQDRSSFCILGI